MASNSVPSPGTMHVRGHLHENEGIFLSTLTRSFDKSGISAEDSSAAAMRGQSRDSMEADTSKRADTDRSAILQINDISDYLGFIIHAKVRLPFIRHDHSCESSI